MDILGYISDIVKSGPVPLGIDDIDEYFLYLILHDHTSAYKIYSSLKTMEHGLSYKNVHRRIQKMLQTNLIEDIKVEGGYKHGARNYRLTNRGLIYYFTEFGSPKEIHNLSLIYHENTLFKTFLYTLFEITTVKHATYSLIKLIENYLEDCCILTRFSLDTLISYLAPEETYATVEIGGCPPLEKLYLNLYWHVKSFLVKTAVLKEGFIDWSDIILSPSELRFPTQGKIRCTANDKRETYELLSRDKKFMSVLEEVEKDFRRGYEKLKEINTKR